ncbi:MAG: AI-2E family transporter [Bdellovibrio sp.]|nr:AI-2E family transporter [Bdellovibrio sp.]
MNNSRQSSTDSQFSERRQFDVAPSFFVKIALFALVIFLVLKLTKLFLLFFVAIFIAVSLNPVVTSIQKLKLPRSFAIGVVTFFLGCSLLWVGLVLAPVIYSQLQVFMSALPDLQHQLISEFSKDGIVSKLLNRFTINGDTDPNLWLNPAITFLQSTMHGLSEFFVVIIMAVYLLIDGKRAFVWFSDFFSAPVRLKLRATAAQTSPVISAYVSAQLISCILCGLFAFTILTAFNVPAALTLAAIAAILDIMPVLGFLMALVPALLLALTVSPATAGVIVIGYACYHAFEVYVLLPMIYRRNLKLGTLVVLLSILVAFTLGGILAAIAILPVVASYPIIERIWLAKYLGRQVVQKHSFSKVDTDLLFDPLSMWNDPLLNFAESKMYNHADRHILKALNKTILIVDDDLDTRALLKDILETEGFCVLEAGDGQDGLEYLKRFHNVGLILLDYKMPVMDGLTFFEKIRSTDNTKNIPVVFLSADDDRIKLVNSGAEEVIRKPVDFDHLMNLIHQHYKNVNTDLSASIVTDPQLVQKTTGLL